MSNFDGNYEEGIYYDDEYNDCDDYGDYEGYDGYSYLMTCPDVTIANLLRKWARAIKDWFWRLRHRNGVDDIPF